ncbi:hypothetical protein [Rhodopirellula bahusiensis]|uniref:hypothetical protein n=1 Tax=Rhodopirellula bahusiensis TaxID=2014065 RepID=UPI0032655740
MAKKRAKKASTTQRAKAKPGRRPGTRVDPLEFGIDMRAVLDEIRPSLEGTYAEIGARAGMPPGSVSNILNGSGHASLGAVAALAHAAGGKLQVEFIPDDTKK